MVKKKQLFMQDLLVVNKTSVIPARLFGEKNTGGKVEIFLERFLSDFQTLAQIKSSRTPKEKKHMNQALEVNPTGCLRS